MNTFIKWRLVSALSLGHHEVKIIQVSEYIQILKIIEQEISFASRYNEKHIPRMQFKNSIKMQNTEDILKIRILVYNIFKIIINTSYKKIRK